MPQQDDTIQQLAPRATDTPRRSWKVPGCSTERLTLSPDGSLIALLADGGIALWDVRSGRRIRTIAVSEAIYSFAFSADGRWMWVGTGKSAVRKGSMQGSGHLAVYDVSTGKIASHCSSKEDHRCRAVSMSFSGDGHIVAVAQCPWSFPVGGAVQIWRTGSRSEVQRIPLRAEDGIGEFVAVSPDGRACAILDRLDDINIHEVATGALRRTIPLASKLELSMNGLRFTPDGKFLVAAGERTPYREDWSLSDQGGFTAEIYIWDRSNPKPRHLIRRPETRVPAFDCCTRRPLLAVVCNGEENAVCIWNWETGKQTQSIATPTRFTPRAVAFSRDGTTLLVGHEDQLITFWPVL